jgi:ABC-type lipoprotein export system ATPase subunit
VTPVAECRAVTVRYGREDAVTLALDGVDVAIEAGDSLSLVGRSGSGKTTLLHVLGGLVEPTAGEVLWKGERRDTLDQSARAGVRAGGIAYVFQGSNLLPHFTAVENVAFARAVSGGDGLEPLALLQLVGLAGKADHLPDELSGGEAQRVAIARALAQNPELLLCDEPTGHLDSDTGRRVLELIEALQQRFGFSLALATHDLDVAVRLRRQIQMHDGRALAEEPPG